jgi:hypothetical protein
MNNGWGSPLKPKKGKEKEEKPTELPKFKPQVINLPKSEAQKIVGVSGLSVQEVVWVQQWLETRLAEKSYPRSFAGKDAFGQIQLFLSPADSSKLLSEIRASFPRKSLTEEREEDFAFLFHPVVQADTQRLLQVH